MAVLQVHKGANPGQLYPLDADQCVLGRHPDCDVVLDIGAVSRQHARIVRVDGEYFVEDLQSRNGTFVNGEQIQGRWPLSDNDRVKICDLLFSFHHEAPNRPAAGTKARRTPEPEAAVLVDGDPSSTIITKLDVLSSDSSLRFDVPPEMKLNAIIEITQCLGGTLNLDVVLSKIVDGLFKIFAQADRGFIVLRTSADGPLVPKSVKHRRRSGDESVRISRTIINQVMSARAAILSKDATSDERFDMSQSIADFQIRSMMCAPLIDSSGTAIGVMQVDTLDHRGHFQQEDLGVLASIAGLAAVAIEMAQLHETALKQERIQRDLELAHRVQRGLMPNSPTLRGYSFFDVYEPASLLGGDYYDYVFLPGGRLAVVLADVSGKGIPAALITAKLSPEVHHSLLSEPDPSRAMCRLNAAFISSGWEDRFITLVLAVIDAERGTVTLANAGHMAPALRRADGHVEMVGVEISGIPLGVEEEAQYDQLTIYLQPGDCLTMYTDGITDAMNVNEQLYGTTRLFSQLRQPEGNVTALGRRILDDVRSFVGKHPQIDDMCLTCFGRE